MDRLITLTGDDLVILSEMASRADVQGTYLRVAYNGRGMSFAVGQGQWTFPLGTDTGNPNQT